MIVLPIDTCETFWRAFAGEITPTELEQWLYAHDAEMEALLPNDVYLDLISLNFSDEQILHKLKALMGGYLQLDSHAYQRFACSAVVLWGDDAGRLYFDYPYEWSGCRLKYTSESMLCLRKYEKP